METINHQSVRDQMDIPPDMQEPYNKIVANGLKLMFGEGSRKLTMKMLDKPGDLATKLGEGVAALLAYMFNQSNNTLPPQLVIPAGTELVVHAAEVASKAGEEVTDDIVAEAMGTFIEAVLRQFGVNQKDIPAMMSGKGA